jgi:hypothetical protein
MAFDPSSLMLFLLFMGILVVIVIVVLWVRIVLPLWRGRPAFVIMCASPGLFSQAGLTHAYQYLHLLSQKGIPTSRVRALLPESCPGCENPSPRAGLPPLPIPAEYRDYPGCIRCFTPFFFTDVVLAILDFAFDPAVTGIVFIYINPSETDSPGALEEGNLKVDDLVSACLQARKPFLAVLDAPFSNRLAEKTIRRLEGAIEWDAEINAAILTSGDGASRHSAVLLSTKTPEFLPSVDGVAYKINSSMFSRSLLLELAHKLGKYDSATLADLPGRMNVAGEEMKHGFEATFQYVGRAMARMPVRFFFPWGPIGDDEMSLVTPTVCFSDVIPREEVGVFFDDIGSGQTGSGSALVFHDISIRNGLVTLEETGELSERDPRHVPILEDLKKCQRNRDAPKRRAEVVQVSFESIANIVCNEFEKLPGGCVLWDGDAKWFDDLHDFVEKLNGRLPVCETANFWRLYVLGGTIDRDHIKGLITEARKQVAEKFDLDLAPDDD